MERGEKIRSYGGGGIQTFESFEAKDYGVKNRFMKELLRELDERGVTPQDFEEPDAFQDGVIELSDVSKINVMTHKRIQGAVQVAEGKYELTKVSNDLSEVLKGIRNLKVQHKVNEANYMNESSRPGQPTPFLLEQRAAKVAKAAKLVESAIQELKNAPKLDEMSDIPDAIKKLEEILGEGEEYGLDNLKKLYEDQ